MLYQQPQGGPALIDSANPINKGLVFAYEGALGHQNTALNILGNPLTAGVATATSPYGLERTFSGSQANSSCSFGNVGWLKDATSATWDILVKVNSANPSGTLFGQWEGINQNWVLDMSAGALIWVPCDDSVGNRTRFDLSGAFPTAGYYRIIASWLGASNKILLVNRVDKTASLSLVNSGGNILSGTFDNFQIGMHAGGTALAGSVVFARAWRRGLSKDECLSLNDAPYQLFLDPDEEDEALMFAPAVSGTPSGSFATTLGNAIMAASGGINNAGSFSSALSNVTMSSSGNITVIGSFATVLGSTTMAASGAVSSTPSGAYAASMADVTMAASGVQLNAGSFASALQGVAMVASGTAAANTTGTYAVSLGDVSMSAYGFTGATPPAALVRSYRWRINRRSFTQ